MRRRLDLQLFARDDARAPASPRKRRRAREQGQVPRSAELVAAAALLAGGLAVRAGGRRAWEGFQRLLAADPVAGGGDAGWALDRLASAAAVFWAALLPVAGAAAAAAVAVGVAQTGGLLSLQPLAPRLDRVDPIRGLARIFSGRGLFELGKALVKFALVALLAYGPVRAGIAALAGAVGEPPARVAAVAAGGMWQLFVRCAAAALVFGALDYAVQRWRWERDLAMTPQEVKEELRDTEGDPTVRARLRRRQRELSRRRMLLDVRRADVIVTNPTHLAVALRYDPATMAAPVVVAKGQGPMARLIRSVGRRYGVPWVEDRFLARALYGAVRVGEPIPESLYAAVAEVLAFVWRLRGRSLADLGVPGKGVR